MDTQRSVSLWGPLLPLIALIPLRKIAASSNAKVVIGFIYAVILTASVFASVHALRKPHQQRFPISFLRHETCCFVAYALLMAGFFAFEVFELPRW